MKRLLPKIISIIIFSNFIACKEDCNYELLNFIDCSIDLVDNSGKSPVSLKDSFVSAKSFGIYYQLNFEQALRPNSCEIHNENSPTNLKIFTINKFDVSHPAGFEVTSAFTILNNDNLYPVSINGATIKLNNHLLLNSPPLRDTIHQFIINGYRNDILIASDTTKAIFLKR